jgi:hypothetical protein
LFSVGQIQEDGAMKKGLKIFLIVAGALVSLLGLGIGLLCIPGVQKQVVLSMLRKGPSSATLDSVRIGLNGARVSGLEMIVDGTVISLESGSFVVPVLPLVLKRQLAFQEIDLDGLDVDLRKNRGGRPFEGILEALDLGGPLSVHELNVDAQVILHEAVSLDLKALGQLDVNSNNQVDIDGRLHLGEESFGFKGELGIEEDSAGRISSVNLEANLQLGASPDATVDVLFSVGAERHDADEQYTLITSLRNGQKVLELLKGTGVYKADSKRTDFHLEGRAVREQLLTFAPELVGRVPEGLRVDVDVTGGTHGASWKLEKGQVVASLSRSSLALRLLKPFALDLDKGTLADLQPGVRVADLKLSFPVERVLPGLPISGPSLEAELFLESTDKGFSITSDGPISWSDLTWTRPDGAVSSFDISMNPMLRKQGGHFTGVIQDVHLKTRNSEILRGKVDFGREPSAEAWNFNVDGSIRMEDAEHLMRGGVSGASFFRPMDRCDLAFTGDFNGATGSIQTFSASIGGGKPWLLAGIPKEIHFHKGKDGHWETNRADSLFELETRELSPVRFGAFHPKMDLKIAPMDSRWLLSLEADESIVLRAKQPVSLKDVSFAWEGTTYVYREEFRCNPVLRFADGFFLQAPDLKLGGLENPLATGSFLFKDLEGKQKWGGEFEVLLPRLSQTMLFKDKGAVVSGSAVIKVGPMGLGTRMDVQLKDVALRDRKNKKVSGTASLLWPEKTKNGESLRSSFELKDDARNSRGTIVVKPQDHYDFNAQELHLDHVVFATNAYLAYAGSGSLDRQKPLPSMALNAKVAQFHVGKGEPFQALQGVFMSGSTGLSLQGLSAKLGTAGLVNGGFVFQQSGGIRNGVLTGSLQCNKIQLEDFFPKPAEGQRAPVEGRTTLLLQVSASGGTLERLKENAEIRLTADVYKGSYRFEKLERKLTAVGKVPEKLGKVSEGVGLLAGPIKLLNPDLANLTSAVGKAGELIAGGAEVLGGLLLAPAAMTNLTRIRFDSMGLDAHRHATGRTDLKKFMVRGPMILMGASGGLGPQPVDQILDASLDLDLHIGVRGVLNQAFSLIHQLDGEDQFEDYMLLKANPIRIRGTLREPKLDSLWSALFPKKVTTVKSRVADPKKDSSPQAPLNPLRDAIKQGGLLFPF